MLSPQQIAIIKSTIPVLEQHGTTITQVFYKNMFAEHPELLNIFNKTNQTQGKQQTALATTVLAAARHIDNLSALLPQVTQISHKHRALQIRPEHYPIVGKHLLGAITEVLGNDATPDILDAWGQAYQEIANVFMSVEQAMYQQADWQGFAPFTVVDKQVTGTDIVKFSVVPAESNEQTIDLSTLTLKAGQYITVQTKPDNSDTLALRHYSLCSVNTSQGLQFAVRRENRNQHQGLVSNYLHDAVKIGDTLYLSAPAGDFSLDNSLVHQNEVPLVLISAGVGITPMLAMLESQIQANPDRPIIWLYACQNADYHAFKQDVATLLAQANHVQQFTFYAEAGQRLDTSVLASLPKPADIYLCGSMAFMESMKQGLLLLQHHNENVHYEPFGPKMSLQV